MSDALSRRTFVLGGLATVGAGIAVSAMPVRFVVAQEGGDLASLGLPVIEISLTESGYEGVPEELEAGRYLVTLQVPEDGGAAAFLSLPEGMSKEDFLAILGGGGEDAPPAGEDATPMAEGEGGEEMGAPPLEIYMARFAGGAAGMSGTVQAVIDLPPGEWLVWADEPSIPIEPVSLTVTGEMPEDLPEPEADITTTFIDFGITVEGNLTAGDHIMLMQNHGAQPHFVFIAKGPDSMTNEQVGQILTMEMGGEMTPEAMPFDPNEDLMPVMFSATQSIGTMVWVPISLEAGTYMAACFFPTAGEGLPHAYHGMHTVFTVG